MQGWIKLHRQLLEWEWYDDINTSRLFIHLLLVANHEDRKWRGIHIKRGQRLTSLDKLSKETGLSVSQIRTCLKKLKSTSEVTSKSHSQHTVFTIENYDSYQSNDKQDSEDLAFESQADDKGVATNKNDKELKEPYPVGENRQPKPSFDYEKVREVWNTTCSNSTAKSAKCHIFPEKAKTQIQRTYKKYCDHKRSNGSEPADRLQWCTDYFKFVLEFTSGFVGKEGEHEKWKPSLEYATRVRTYELVMEWIYDKRS